MTTKFFELPEDAVKGTAKVIKVENHVDRAIVSYEEDFHFNTEFLPKFDHGLNAYSLVAAAQYGEATDEEYRKSIVECSYSLETAQRIADEINRGA